MNHHLAFSTGLFKIEWAQLKPLYNRHVGNAFSVAAGNSRDYLLDPLSDLIDNPSEYLVRQISWSVSQQKPSLDTGDAIQNLLMDLWD